MSFITGTMVGKIVQSDAGRDGGRLYVVIGQTDAGLLLSDGRRRRMNHPKKKKRIHCNVVSEVGKECLHLLTDGRCIDSLLRGELTTYRNQSGNVRIYERRDFSAEG